MIKRVGRGLLLLGALWCLTGCALGDSRQAQEPLPDLRLVSWQAPAEVAQPAREQGTQEAGAQASTSPKAVEVDFWLDSTPNFGGVNPLSSSIFRTSNNNFIVRGGFHYNQAYRRQTYKGWYADVLDAFLDAEKRRGVRILRYGNEYLSDAFLAEMGLSGDAAELSSLRRDMMTYAVYHPLTPEANTRLYDRMAGTERSNGFYAIASETNYPLAQIDPDFLENPERREAMGLGIAEYLSRAGSDAYPKSEYFLNHHLESRYAPLLYALENMDLGRLNVIVTDTLGQKPIGENELYRELLEARGVFSERGLTAGILALQLDYCGYLSEFMGEQYDEVFQWGKYSRQTNNEEFLHYAAPRPLLVLIIGRGEEVERFLRSVEATFDTLPVFQEIRTKRGRSEIPSFYFDDQEQSIPSFAFAYRDYRIGRTDWSLYTEASGVPYALRFGPTEEEALRQGAWNTVRIAPTAEGDYPAGTIDLSLSPRLEELPEDMGFAEGQGLTAQVRLLRQKVQSGESLENEAGLLEGYADRTDVEAVALRDRVFLFEETVYEGGTGDSPFSIEPGSGRYDADQNAFMFSIHVEEQALRPGYYRLQLLVTASADALEPTLPAWLSARGGTGEAPQVIDLTEGEEVWRMPETWSYTPDGATRALWRGMASVIHQETAKRYRHGWGFREILNRSPNIPPVFLLFQAEELVDQMLSAASPGERTLISLTFDVFVDNEPGESPWLVAARERSALEAP